MTTLGSRTDRWRSAGSCLVALMAAGLLATSVAQADPLYQMATWGDGVAKVLVGDTGTGSATYHPEFNPGILNVGTVGGTEYLFVMDNSAYRHDVFILDTAGETRNDTPVKAQAGIFNSGTYSSGGFFTDAYIGTVRGAVDGGDVTTYPGTQYGSLGSQGLTGWTGGGTMFGVTAQTNGSIYLNEFRPETSAGVLSVSAGTAGLQVHANVGVDTSAIKTAGAVVGPGSPADTFNFVLMNLGNGALRKVAIGASSGVTGGQSTYATRAVATGGQILDAGASGTGLIGNLVPGVNDTIVCMNVNPADGNLYFLSGDASNDKVYVSAISVTWNDGLGGDDLASNGLGTYVDLDPVAAGVQSFFDVSYDASAHGDGGSDLLRAAGLAFSADGSKMYVSNGDKSTYYYTNGNTGDRVFVFELVPEPTTLTMLALSTSGLVLARRRRRR